MTIGQQQQPYIFTPNPVADNGPAIRSALLAGYRRIWINGSSCPIGTTVTMNNPIDFTPYHGTVIEPAPGISKVNIDASGIGRNQNDLTDTHYSAFDYQGNVKAASYLTSSASINSTQIFVADSTKYTNGDWIVISDNSTSPSTYLYPVDGPMEVRQVLYVLTGSIIVDKAFKRSHPVNAIVAICTPIRDLFFRGLEFAGDCTVGLHAHFAQSCTFSNITSVNWTGRCMLLVDYGGSNNLLVDSYCTGTTPGAGPGQNAWGVVVEGQDSTHIVNCGGEKCGNGTAMNYSIDTISFNAQARLNNVNVNPNFGSIRSGFIRPRTASPIIADWVIGQDCVDCYVFEPQPL